jgi:maltose phosphorylase
MAKVAKHYLEVDPWVIEEKGFHPEHSLVSESIFSVANEFMGVRGYFEEGCDCRSMLGSYFNGIYIRGKHQYSTKFRGFAEEYTYMVNAVDWLYTRILLDGEKLDLAHSEYTDFARGLDMREGVLYRSFVWKSRSGKSVRFVFKRFVSMDRPFLGVQRIEIEPIDFSGQISLKLGLDFSTTYYLKGRCMWKSLKRQAIDDVYAIMAAAEGSNHRIFSAFRLDCNQSIQLQKTEEDDFIGVDLSVKCEKGKPLIFEKMTYHHTEKNPEVSDDKVWEDGLSVAEKYRSLTFEQALQKQKAYWANTWEQLGVGIEGAPEDEQGLRFSLFTLYQTYHGLDASLNVGAKGLTGEHYWGVAFWDTETYCLPFYLFNNPSAAENLLRYRYKTLKGALERAKQLDCEGARYPMCTIDGEEICDVWQHGDLEIHISAAVAYGLMLYEQVSGDRQFLYDEGVEMLLQICRYYASRGGWGERSGQWGYYGVMGPDEMHMMVNNNCYTNMMAKKTMEYTLGLVEKMKLQAPAKLKGAFSRVSLRDGELADWADKAGRTYIPQDKKTMIFEQHDGYFDLPHIGFHSIDESQFPLAENWAYVRRLRYDLIKQPDVLLLMLFFSGEFNYKTKLNNYEFYEPRCCHESSLSPCIHSVLAAELGRDDEAHEYSKYAFRLDLDNYNNNTNEGLHVTAMAGAWMNLVYGFARMRVDGGVLRFAPSIPKGWRAFHFTIIYRGCRLNVQVDRKTAWFKVIETGSLSVRIFEKVYEVTTEGVSVSLC